VSPPTRSMPSHWISSITCSLVGGQPLRPCSATCWPQQWNTSVARGNGNHAAKGEYVINDRKRACQKQTSGEITKCPLLALSGHAELHRTCPLSGVKRTPPERPQQIWVCSGGEGSAGMLSPDVISASK